MLTYVYFPFVGHLHRICLIKLFAVDAIKKKKRKNAWLIYAIGINFAEGIFMQVKSCHNTFQQVGKLGTFELKNPNTRTEHQCHAQLSQPLLP